MSKTRKLQWKTSKDFLSITLTVKDTGEEHDFNLRFLPLSIPNHGLTRQVISHGIKQKLVDSAAKVKDSPLKDKLESIHKVWRNLKAGIWEEKSATAGLTKAERLGCEWLDKNAFRLESDPEGFQMRLEILGESWPEAKEHVEKLLTETESDDESDKDSEE